MPKYPDVKVEIAIDYGLTDIVAQRYDAGVRWGEQVGKDMIAVRASKGYRAAIVGAPSYFKTHSKPRTPHDVLNAPRQEFIAQLAGVENIFDAIVVSQHADRGTMTCRVGPVLLETPLVRADIGSPLRVGIRAGDILLAITLPVGLSARNVIPGRIVALDRRDVMIAARVDCGVEMEVHLTLAARDALDVQPGRQVWLVIKTHSCHLMQG